MIKFERGSHLYTLFTLISVVGEFPTSSLSLLMSYELARKMIKVWSKRQEVICEDGQIIKNCRLFSVVGDGKTRRIRIHSSAYEILDKINMKEFYLNNFVCKKFPSSADMLLRRFREAEAVAVLFKAGYEIRPYIIPKLQNDKRIQRRLAGAVLYTSFDVKKYKTIHINTIIRSSKISNLLIINDEAYAIYNLRNEPLEKAMKGELKTKLFLDNLLDLNYKIGKKDNAMFIGRNYSVALKTLRNFEKKSKRALRLDDIYLNVFFIPYTDFGVKLASLFRIRNFRTEILRLVFREDFTCEDESMTTHSIYKNGRYYFSFLDGNIAKLMRFKDFMSRSSDNYFVACYEEQEEFIREYMGERAKIMKVKIDEVYKYFLGGETM